MQTSWDIVAHLEPLVNHNTLKQHEIHQNTCVIVVYTAEKAIRSKKVLFSVWKMDQMEKQLNIEILQRYWKSFSKTFLYCNRLKLLKKFAYEKSGFLAANFVNFCLILLYVYAMYYLLFIFDQVSLQNFHSRSNYPMCTVLLEQSYQKLLANMKGKRSILLNWNCFYIKRAF